LPLARISRFYFLISTKPDKGKKRKEKRKKEAGRKKNNSVSGA
jgi:hypothetical protein